jgi:uncharacterized protein (DUF2062 family)
MEGFWPRAGWGRALSYLRHRVRRLPDTPHKVGRGVFAGILIGMLPVFGLQFVLAGLLAWAIRGNILAAVICTFVSNPLTYAPMGLALISFGHWTLGMREPLSARLIARSFAKAGDDLWFNVQAIFTHDVTRWDGLVAFWHTIFLPYLVGGLIVGTICGLIGHALTVGLVRAYQSARARKLAERTERIRRLRSATPDARPAAADRPEGEAPRGGDSGATAP